MTEVNQQEKVLVRFEIMKPVPSMNVWERMFFKRRHAIKEAFRQEVNVHVLMQEIPPRIPDDRYPIRFRFTQMLGKGSRRYDSSNWNVAAKIIEDAFVSLRIIPDDRREFVQLFTENPPEEHRQKLCGGVRVEVLVCEK
jgi:hypothetical protein